MSVHRGRNWLRHIEMTQNYMSSLFSNTLPMELYFVVGKRRRDFVLAKWKSGLFKTTSKIYRLA